jgi:alkylmercury lyase
LKVYVGAIPLKGRFMSSVKFEGWSRAVVDATPDLDSEGRRITIQAYRLLARGEPVTPAQIADAAGVSRERTEELLRSWRLVLWDDQDRVVGFFGLQSHHVEPTHRMDVDGTPVFGWCAGDTLLIPEILEATVDVESADPVSGATIRLTVTPEGVTGLEPPEAVMSLLYPEDELTEKAIQSFCHRVYFFESPETAHEWIAGRPGMFTVTIDEAFQLLQLVNRLRLGPALDQVGAT